MDRRGSLATETCVPTPVRECVRVGSRGVGSDLESSGSEASPCSIGALRWRRVDSTAGAADQRL
ncbi:hypothetical protein WJ16_11585 [Burkholderia metallica]|nr:hypothetical protein WJ16_11585 [Burkholderia metallica]